MKTNYREGVKGYLNDLSQKGCQPGGGSAGALAFCLGVSLVAKSIRHTLAKEIPNARKDRLKKKLEELLTFEKIIYPYIDKDGEIFSDIIHSKGEKKKENLALGNSLLQTLADVSEKAFFLAKGLESDIKKMIKSDFFLGIEFIKISQNSALLNLKANKDIFK